MNFFSGKKVPLLYFESLPNNSHLQHAVLTRLGGQSPDPYESLNLSESVPDLKSNVLANRALAYNIVNRTNDTLVHAHLVHGKDVAVVSSKDYGQYVGPVDALITDQPGCGITMNYADCSPILLYDPVKNVIGLGHSGWKGAVVDLAGAMVLAMHESYGSLPEHLIAGIGPTIGPCCYEIRSEVISAVRGSFDDSSQVLIHREEESAVINKNTQTFFDLSKANHFNLIRAGVRMVERSDLCTACRTDLFFSHREENGQTGRFGALMVLQPG